MEAEEFAEPDLAGAQARGEALIADRLDSLEAEQVFHRALELEADALDEPHLFTADQLEAIAAEINMDPTYVRQALGEVRLAPAERGWLDRRILPDPIMATETIEGLDRAELDAAIDRWMSDYEGLIAAGRVPDGMRWDVDRRLSKRLKTMQTSGGNRISRVAGGDVLHRVHTMGDDEHVVAMQSKGEGPLLVAKAGLTVAAAIVALGSIAALNSSSIGAVVTVLSAMLVVGGGIAGAAVAGARRWAKGIRRALGRSLTGLSRRLTRSSRDTRSGPVRDIAPVAGEIIAALADRFRTNRSRHR